MRYVYCIAFRGNEFLMVFNPKRSGWEMPGGKVEEGESDLDAAQREFREETGRELLVQGCMDMEEGSVFAGEVGETSCSGEMDWCLFDALPDKLSFPLVEYLPLITWARQVRDPRDSDDEETTSA